MKLRSLVVALTALLLSSCGGGARDEVRLVVTVVVDGLSTEQVLRHRECYGEGGFERFFREGAWFPRARYAHTTTFTAPGHATIATGTTPREHGMVSNGWLDYETGRSIYCVSDENARLVAAQRTERKSSSASTLLVPSLADVLHARKDQRSRSLGLSLKDRSAVLGAGRHGEAYWYRNNTGEFVTSTAYREAPAEWWRRYYQGDPTNAYLGRSRRADACERDWHAEHEASLEGLEPSDPRFQVPEPMSAAADENYYYSLKTSPWADRETFEFLETAREAMELGESPRRVDHLFVSFSALDYVSHDLGPESPTATAVVQELDRLLQRLFALLDAEVGGGRWVLAFTADHGYPTSPEIARARGEDAGRLDPRAMQEAIESHLDELHGEAEWVIGWRVPTFYLNRATAESRGVDFGALQNDARELLLTVDGVHAVVTRAEIESDSYDGPFAAGVRESYYPRRSGDLLVLQDRNWYLLGRPMSNACTHGSPWDYDREVPLFFLGGPVNAGTFDRAVEIRDIAPTLLALLGEPPAPTMSGQVLGEVLRD